MRKMIISNTSSNLPKFLAYSQNGLRKIDLPVKEKCVYLRNATNKYMCVYSRYLSWSCPDRTLVPIAGISPSSASSSVPSIHPYLNCRSDSTNEVPTRCVTNISRHFPKRFPTFSDKVPNISRHFPTRMPTYPDIYRKGSSYLPTRLPTYISRHFPIFPDISRQGSWHFPIFPDISRQGSWHLPTRFQTFPNIFGQGSRPLFPEIYQQSSRYFPTFPDKVPDIY